MERRQAGQGGAQGVPGAQMRQQCFRQYGKPSTIREDAWQCLGATGKEEPQAYVVKGQERRVAGVVVAGITQLACPFNL